MLELDILKDSNVRTELMSHVRSILKVRDFDVKDFSDEDCLAILFKAMEDIGERIGDQIDEIVENGFRALPEHDEDLNTKKVTYGSNTILPQIESKFKNIAALLLSKRVAA